MKPTRLANQHEYTNVYKKPCLLISKALILAALLISGQHALATNYTWNVSSGNWSTPGSWSTTGSGVPGSADTAIFGNSDTSSGPTVGNNTVDLGFAGTIAGLT